MATYKFYNIQAKPLSETDGFIGAEGYKTVFKSLRSQVKDCMSEKAIDKISFSLANEMYLAPTSVTLSDNYATGQLMKYDRVDGVFDTYEGTPKYQATGTESSKRYRFNFLFDYNTHILAVENTSKSPSGKVIENAMLHFLTSHLYSNFENYYLDVIELKSAASLDKVLEPENRFQKVCVNVTFSNSQDWIDEMEQYAESIDKEMREKAIDKIEIREEAKPKSSMSKPSKHALGVLALAPKFGNAAIKYINAAGQKISYHMANFPIKIRVSPSKKGVQKTPAEYNQELLSAIAQANKEATESTQLLKQLRGNNE